MENMIRTFELKDTDKTVELKVVAPLRDGDNEEMLYAYTDYLIDILKHYHEDIEDVITLDDVLEVLEELAAEEKENRLTFGLNVWKVKEEFYNYFSDDNYIVNFDDAEEDDRYDYFGVVTVTCEFSVEDY